jgi:hypothetical protein
MEIVKIVVCGPFASGKTEIIKNISEIDVVSTEAKITSREESLVKGNTTVAMDFGKLTIDEELVLHLYGTPGQERFNFMWDILSTGMLGFIVMIDSTDPSTFKFGKRVIDFFNALGNVPFVVVANKQDLPDAWEPDDIKFILNINENTPVIPCIAKDVESSKTVFIELLTKILNA